MVTNVGFKVRRAPAVRGVFLVPYFIGTVPKIIRISVKQPKPVTDGADAKVLYMSGTKTRHMYTCTLFYPFLPWQTRFLCGDSDYLLGQCTLFRCVASFSDRGSAGLVSPYTAYANHHKDGKNINSASNKDLRSHQNKAQAQIDTNIALFFPFPLLSTVPLVLSLMFHKLN